jgi:hypothetical protein
MKIPNEVAILGAGAIIGASILASQMVGHYQLVAGVNNDGTRYMMRIDTLNGVIENCRAERNGDPTYSIHCYADYPLQPPSSGGP